MIGYAYSRDGYTATEGRSLAENRQFMGGIGTFFSMGLMVPMTGGLSGIQLLIIWLVYQGTTLLITWFMLHRKLTPLS